MAIKGSLSEANLPDVIQLLSFSLKSGCLSVTDGRNFGNIFIKEGKIVYATLLNRKDRLGDVLLKKGIIDESMLKQALEEQRTKSKRLGEILVEKGFITQEILAQELTNQITETIFTMLTWESGYFNFEADLLPGPGEFLVQLSPQQVLLEGARRIDEWRKIENKLPPFETVLVVKSETQGVPLTLEEEKVLSLIDGTRTIDDILKLSEFDFFETCRTIYGLISAGLVEKPKKTLIEKKTVGDITEYKNLGFAFLKTEMYEEAEREFKKILEIDPNNVEALLYQGLIELRRKNYDRAKEYLTRADSIEKRPSILNNLGYLYLLTDEVELALKFLTQAKESAPDNPKVNCNLGIAHYKNGELDKAREILSQVIEKKPELLTPHIYLSVILVKIATIRGGKEEVDEAINFLKTCINRFPRNEIFKNNLAVLYEAIDLPEEAERSYRQALEDAPNDYFVLKNLADFYYESQILGAARELYEKIPEEKRDWEVLFKLGNIYMRQGDTEEALNNWQKAKALNPEQEIITRNIEVLQKARGK
ncbi:MAG: tetratricopeptide repeat protein [candidate division WOR-3 bacterium]